MVDTKHQAVQLSHTHLPHRGNKIIRFIVFLVCVVVLAVSFLPTSPFAKTTTTIVYADEPSRPSPLLVDTDDQHNDDRHRDSDARDEDTGENPPPANQEEAVPDEEPANEPGEEPANEPDEEPTNEPTNEPGEEPGAEPANTPKPFLGDPPPEDELPPPLSETSPDRALAPVEVSAKTGTSPVTLRKGPGREYPAADTLDPGTSITIVGRAGNWLQVRLEGDDTLYWVASAMVDISDYWLYTLFKVNFDQAHPSEPDGEDEEPTSTEAATDSETEAEPALLVGTINDAPVSLHNGPGTLYAKIGTAQPETKVTLLAYYEDWYQIELEDGAVGWVFADLLTISPAIQERVPMAEHVPPAPSGVRPSGDVASYAIQYVGYPYVYGGTTPHGFDCSGFVQYVYAQHGVYLPRTAAQQYSTAHGVVVERMHELAPGDLMFFVNTSTPGISHVAIYIGDGRMVHAMSYSVGVGVSNIWDTYWVSHYYGAIRVRR